MNLQNEKNDYNLNVRYVSYTTLFGGRNRTVIFYQNRNNFMLDLHVKIVRKCFNR